MMEYLHQLHGDFIYFPAGVWGLKQHQIEQGHQVTWVIPEKQKKDILWFMGWWFLYLFDV